MTDTIIGWEMAIGGGVLVLGLAISVGMLAWQAWREWTHDA